MASREVLLEFQRIGTAVKVTATDPDTLVEVTIQGPVHAGQESLARVAVAKLGYVLERRRAGAPRPAGRPTA